MPQPAYTRTAIQQLIRDNGPMTAAELTEALQMKRITVTSCIAEARNKYGTKFFRIADYRRQEGQGGREAPIYGLGPEPDVKPLKFGDKTRREVQKRYADKMRATINARHRVRRNQGAAINPFEQLIPKNQRGSAAKNSLSI